MNRSPRLGADGEDGLQVLWHDRERVFCRRWRLDGDGKGRAVLAVLPASEHPTPASLDRFVHEYALKDELDGRWAVPPLELVHEGGRTMLVLDDPGGEPLEGLLGAPMEMGGFLRLAVSIVTALGKVHQGGLVHKDIKPGNIIVNRASGEIRLTGFGIATRLLRERQAPEPPETIAGTLAYMAPEQTGRMNRSIDSRSDLYSLGVTFYQMLTGALPFAATDPMDWVHCHIAKKPMPPGERLEDMPASISAIVMKLLAKTPEERYQTAVGVERDLRRCLAEWERQRRIDDFPLGQQDTPDRLLIPEKLYGRAREVETILAAFDRVIKSGAPELVLVSGYSGIGKSSVVNELHKALDPPRGLFASGKFDQYKRDIPYSTLIQAFQSLVRTLLGKSDAELDGWRRALLEALGPNVGLMSDLIPELKLITGDPPPVPELEPQQAQSRFQLVFRRFIGVFARPEHPLALFLDDLQWLDTATLDLLEDLLTRSELQHLMLVGAYRDNEVDAAHPLTSKLDAIKNAGGKIGVITLAPLTPEHLGELIADAVRCEPERAAPLAELVHEQTAGNPFFVIQFLHSLAEEGLLRFDHDAAGWSWDLDRILAKGYAENVADLMAGKLIRLPAETQQALQQLACLGNVAAIATLSIVLGIPKERVQAALWPAVRQELIERLDGSYKFMHDRVQEAAYSLIPEAMRAEVHLRIGRLLVTRTPPEKQEEAIFDIVNQLNRGAALITSRDEREQLAELNLIAGQRAKASAAYASALSYLIAGAALLAEDSWERRHTLIFKLELHRAECEFLTGALAEAEQRLAALSRRAANTVERARVACLRVDLYTTLDQGSRAIAVGLDYLRHLGIDWSPHPAEAEARREYDRIWSQLGSRTIEALIELPLMSDPASLATLEVLTKIGPPALYTDANLFALVTCRAVNLSIERGNCDASCAAYTYLGIIAGPRFGDYQPAYRFGRLGYDLVEGRGLTLFRARIYMDFGNVVLPWSRHIRAGRDLVRRAFEAANKIGDITYAAYCGNELNTNLLAAGDPLAEVEREAEHGLAFAQKARFGFVIDTIATQLGLIRTLRGLTPTFGSFDDEQFDERRIERHFSENPDLAFVECWYWVRKLQARFFAGDYASAIEASSRAQRLLWTSPSYFEKAEYEFYSALSHAASWDAASADQRQHHVDAVAVHQRQLQLWAANCPENFENRAALIGAEVARIEGRELDAERLYEQAIRSARANGFIHNEALASELAARFYAARDFEKIARVYLQDARYAYLRWGADGKVRQLEEIYPYLREEELAPGPTSTIGTPVEHLDLATVIKVSQAISGEMVLEKMLDTLMRTAIAQAGAERGLLILSRGAEPRIAAEATTSGNTILVELRDAPVTATDVLPESVLHYVLRTRESVILDDAATQPSFAADPYIRQRQAHSILCLPLVNQSKLIGVLYLENNLTPRAFVPARIAVLKLLASQAAISLENTRLYRDLEQREAKIRRLVDSNIIGICIVTRDGDVMEANDAFLKIVGYNREDFVAGRVQWMDLTTPESRDRTAQAMAELKGTGTIQPFEKEYFRKDGSRVPVLVGAAAYDEERYQLVSFVLDLTERKRSEQELRESEERFRTLVQFSFDVYWESDAQHRFIRQEFAESVADAPGPGYELGKTRWEVPYLEPDAEAWRKHRETLDAHLPFRDFELARPAPDGGKRYVSVSGLPAFDETGRFIGYRGVGRHITERKRAEEERRYHMQLLKTVTDNASSMLYIVDAAGLGTFVNPSFERITGYRAEEVIGQVVHDKIHHMKPDGTPYPVHECPLTGAVRQRHVLHGEDLFVRKDGTFFPVGYTASPLFRDGEAVGTLIEVQDLTETKAAEAELRNQAQLLSLAHDAIIVRDPECRITFWNEGAAKTYGWTAEEAIGRVGHELLQTRFPVSRRAVEVALEEHGEWEGELTHITRQGTAIFVTSRQSLQRDEHGAGRAILEINRDITERKQAEEELRASEARFRTFVDHASDTFMLHREDGTILDVNRQACESLGYSRDELIGMAPITFDPDANAAFVQSIKERLEAGEIVTFEARNRRKDGTVLPVEVRVREFSQGSQRLGISLARDITERKRAEAEARESERQYREMQMDLAHANRVATMGRLTASIAHEVNQPIAATMTNAQAALRFLDAPTMDLDEVRQILNDIVKDGNRAGEVIGRIRDLVKKAPPRRDRLEINGAIREVIELTRGETTKNGVSVHTELADCLPLVQGDRVQLQQVILNLIVNAIEAVSGLSEGPRELLISTGKVEPGGVLVTVRDSGPGLAPATLEHLFDSFYTTKPSGLGLGLSICRSIVEAHGGRLWASANVPHGAIFQFTVPTVEGM